MQNKMGRPTKPYKIKLRGEIYAVKLPSWNTIKSTGCKRKSDAERIAIEWVKEEKRLAPVFKENRHKLKTIAQDFFLETNEYVVNERDHGLPFSSSHAKKRQESRSLINKVDQNRKD